MSARRFLGRFRADERGVAAVEMSLVTGVFALAMLNAVEIGRYAYVLMEAGQATQAGAEAAYVTCDSNHLPATVNCPSLDSAVTTAIQSTSLGAHVTINGAITWPSSRP
jgi:Flp pilus assembly pilin Flp